MTCQCRDASCPQHFGYPSCYENVHGVLCEECYTHAWETLNTLSTAPDLGE